MKTKCSITITRPNGREKGTINIRLVDEVSRTGFFDGQIALADFAEALTGLSSCPIEGTFYGLANIGKRIIKDQREIYCPITTYDRTALMAWLEANAQDDGWIISTYLGSQTSVSPAPDGKGQILRYSVTKYVDVLPGEDG